MRVSRRSTSRRAAATAAGVGAAASFLVGLCLVASPSGVFAAECAKEELKIGIVEASGCFAARNAAGDSPAFETSEKFMMNGFHVEPLRGAKVVFRPEDGRRAPLVATDGGFARLSATGAADSATAGNQLTFDNLSFSFSPPDTGEVVLAQSAFAQPGPLIVGLSPLSIKQPITLSEEGSEIKLSFELGGLLAQMLTKTEKQVAFGVGFEVENGSFRIAEGEWEISEFEIGEVFAIPEASATFSAKRVDVHLEAMLKGLGKGPFTKDGAGLIGGFTWEPGRLDSFTVGLIKPNWQIGTSGVFFQKSALTVFTAPPLGASGSLDVTMGPKIKFLGHDVSALEAEGTVEVRGADLAAKKPGFIRVGGKFTVVTLPIASANFAYYFGQGTEFGANIGIGLPSGTNDPGQPTYVGGRFSGWTSASHFDLDSTATLKVAGIDLAGAKTVLSDYGFAGCVQLIAWIGGGVRWSDGRGEVLGGWTCNIGGYQRSRTAMQQLASGHSARLSLEEEEQVIRIEAVDPDLAPDLTLEHEDGRVLTSPADDDADGVVRHDDGVALTDDFGTTTFMPADDPSGDWHLAAEPGSGEIGVVATASELPDHNLRARITGKGRTRTLHWRARKIRHQRLQFSEVLPSGREVLIHETRRRRGSYRFRPAFGPGTHDRERKLAVDVMQRLNTPRDELVADTYRVRRLAAPPKVRALRAHRQLDDVVVSWKRSPGAAAYHVAAKPSGAGTLFREIVRGGRHRVRLSSVGVSKRLQVSVTPVNHHDRRGRAATRTIDTEEIVGGIHHAARRLVAGARRAGPRRLVAHPACPASGHCRGLLIARSGSRVVGRQRFSLPADMTDRLVVRLRAGSAGGLALTGRVRSHAGGRVATARRAPG